MPKIPPTPGTPTRVPCGAQGQGGCACSHSTKSRGSFYGSGGGARDSPAPKAAWPLSGLERKRQAGGRAREGSGSSQHRGGLGVWGQLGLPVPARMAAPSPVPWVPGVPSAPDPPPLLASPSSRPVQRCRRVRRGAAATLGRRGGDGCALGNLTCCAPRCPGSTRQGLITHGPARPTALPARWLTGTSGRAGHPGVPSTPVRAGGRKHVPVCACWDLCMGTWRAREGPQSQDEPPPAQEEAAPGSGAGGRREGGDLWRNVPLSRA